MGVSLLSIQTASLSQKLPETSVKTDFGCENHKQNVVVKGEKASSLLFYLVVSPCFYYGYVPSLLIKNPLYFLFLK